MFSHGAGGSGFCQNQRYGQTHKVLQRYIELNFIAHPEVSYVVVEYLIQARVPMAMHESLKKDAEPTKASVKAQTGVVEKLE
jgi:hypothetical protein